MTAICQMLEWDSRFFGYRVARVEGHTLNQQTAAAALAWAAANEVDCLYFLADASSGETVAAAEAHGFALMDLRVTYEWRVAALPPAPLAVGTTIRPARSDDVAALEAIARDCYTDTRFFYDQHFAPAAPELYATWIRQSCTGQTGIVLVLMREDEAAGYISCTMQGVAGQIGLVGMAATARNRGLGLGLVRAAQEWFVSQGATRVSVVTQGRNIAAQRLYQGVGFLISSVQIWYHRWFDREG